MGFTWVNRQYLPLIKEHEALKALADGSASQADLRVASTLTKRRYLGWRHESRLAVAPSRALISTLDLVRPCISADCDDRGYYVNAAKLTLLLLSIRVPPIVTKIGLS